jgi:hypothetical protein
MLRGQVRKRSSKVRKGSGRGGGQEDRGLGMEGSSQIALKAGRKPAGSARKLELTFPVEASRGRGRGQRRQDGKASSL